MPPKVKYCEGDFKANVGWVYDDVINVMFIYLCFICTSYIKKDITYIHNTYIIYVYLYNLDLLMISLMPDYKKYHT